MIVNVVMLAFQPETQIYPIYVPNGATMPVDQLLDAVFIIGNHDDRPHAEHFCSVSCGDVALVGEDRYLCARNGWKKLTINEMVRYSAMDRMDRVFCDLMK